MIMIIIIISYLKTNICKKTKAKKETDFSIKQTNKILVLLLCKY